jgi:deoxyribodipyrimidine photolyase
MMITGEYKVKKQKNGNEHHYTYYHCTKKSKLKCPEPCIRQEELDRQLSSLIQKFSLRPDWAAELNTMFEKEKTETAQSATAFVQEAGERIRAIQTKLQRLLDGYLE